MVLPSRFLSFSFVLLLFLLLEVVHRVVRVLLKVPEVEIRELVVEDVGLLSLGEDMVSTMLYLGDLRLRPLI